MECLKILFHSTSNQGIVLNVAANDKELKEHEHEVNQYCIGAKRKSRYPQQADRRDHPDHLGSSSFITNASGNVDQHLQYLPFGEPWIDQRTSNNIRFTFSGKERDEETGYNYFGARYYNADISIWLSVDPLSDQYPSHSGYNYVMNNPIKLVDPNGMWVEGAGLLNNFFKSDDRNKAEMKAKQLSAGGASNISVNRIDGGWQTSYTTQNNEEIDGADYALNEHGFIDFDKSKRGSSPITGILAAASANASYFQAVFENDAKFIFKYNQRINGIKKLATDITAENKASSLKTARGLSRIGRGLTLLSVGVTIIDGVNSGWENHHIADIAITAAIYGTALAVPGAGWIVGGAYFLLDMGFQEYTGKSLTQNLFSK
jgi:RHS repeat-associated protein